MRVTKDDVRGAYKYYGVYDSRPGHGLTVEYILRSNDPKERVLCFHYEERSWFEIDQDSFLKLLEFEKAKPSEMKEETALWYLEWDEAFNGEGDDAAVNALIAKWTEKKDEYRSGFNHGWPAKLVKTSFYLKGKKYCITPEQIGLRQGDPWDHGLMEYIQGEIGADLEALGATDIFHHGFLD